MPFIVATYVYASSQGQRTHSARTNFWIYEIIQNHVIDFDSNLQKESTVESNSAYYDDSLFSGNYNNRITCNISKQYLTPLYNN